MSADLFARLRRFPDVEAPNLHAVDGADRLLLDTTAAALDGADPASVVVLGDNYGAVTLGLADRFGLSGLRVHQDLVTGEAALAANAEAMGLRGCFHSFPLGPELLDGARVVLARLPRGLDELAELADAVARWASPQVTVYAGGRDKHMTAAMNEVLTGVFETVTATRGRQKSRVLVASDPRPVGDPPFPVRTYLSEIGLTVVAHGGVFAGARLDIGTRFLLAHLDAMAPQARLGVDLGCGTGILATVLARSRPQMRVIATDRSAAAVASARATADSNGVGEQVQVVRDDAAGEMPVGSVDLVVCNPPFHLGGAVHTGAAEALFRGAGRALRSGGELWTVHNSHLDYRRALQAAAGPTRVVARNAKFTVTRSTRR
ncbi:MAG TPA: methyltransferase [Aldersonia sp.]